MFTIADQIGITETHFHLFCHLSKTHRCCNNFDASIKTKTPGFVLFESKENLRSIFNHYQWFVSLIRMRDSTIGRVRKEHFAFFGRASCRGPNKSRSYPISIFMLVKPRPVDVNTHMKIDLWKFPFIRLCIFRITFVSDYLPNIIADIINSGWVFFRGFCQAVI